MAKQLTITIFLLLIMLAICNAQKGNWPNNFGDLFNSEKLLLGKNIFRGDVGYSLSKVSYQDGSGELVEYFRHATKINFNINPWRDLYLRNTLMVDMNRPEIAPPWLSNYFFQIGYYNWRSNTFSFGYENYQPTTWYSENPTFWTNVKRGYFFGSYNYTFSNPDTVDLRPLFWDNSSKITLEPFLRIHPEYPDERNELGGHFKPIIGGNIRYVIIANIYVETGLFYYPIPATKLPWDPDFTYGFGIYDWRGFRINLTYGNWIANRFPWHDNPLDYYDFLNGEFTLSFTYSW